MKPQNFCGFILLFLEPSSNKGISTTLIFVSLVSFTVEQYALAFVKSSNILEFSDWFFKELCIMLLHILYFL